MKITPAMNRAMERIKDGQHGLVDMTSAKALERRGLIEITGTRHKGKIVNPKYLIK